MYNCYLSYLIFCCSHNNSFSMLCIVLHRRYPVTRMRNHLSTRGWMRLLGIQSKSAYKRRQKAKSKTDNGPRDFVSNRINRCRGTIQPQRHVTCYARSIRVEFPLSLPPRPITMEIHWYAIDTRGILTSMQAMCVNVLLALVCMWYARDLRENRASEILVFMFFNRISIEYREVESSKGFAIIVRANALTRLMTIVKRNLYW